MRGESGDVGVGMVGGPGGVVDPELTRAGAKTPVSPPLSAAASQVSLVPSDLTTSDPDLTMSSAASTVSSSGVTTPDLQPPSASEDDQSEPPMSPSEEEPPEPPIPLEEEDEEEEEEMEVEEHATSETPSTTSQDDPMAPHTPTESSNPSEEEHCPSTPDEEEQVLSENGVTTAGEAVKEAAKKEEEISKGALTPVQPDAWDCEESQKLPTPEAYRAETEFPTSPMALKTNRRMSGVCFAGDEDLGRIAMSNTDTTADTTAMVSTPLETPSEDSDITPPNTHNSSTSSNFLTPNFRPDSLKLEGSSKKEDGFEVNSDIEDEEYFEEFHLPNTHENAFVRHKSFRRKVQLTPINAPDAERIEGLVMTGELQRHGSIRRKIVPETHDTSKTSSQSSTSTFERDLKEIKSMLDECEIDEEEGYSGDQENSLLESSPLPNNTSFKPSTPHNQQNQQANTSTPKTDNTDDSMNIMADITDISSEQYESLSIEQSTMEKIMECLDIEKSKDLYVITGKLQDILSPTEVEEVLNNSERYSDYLNQEILEALSNSLHEHLGSSNKTGNTDSGISSPKKLTLISAQGLELDSAEEKTDFMATLDDSEQSEKDTPIKPQSKPALENAEDNGNLKLKRRSLVLNKGDKELEVEAIFVESNNENTGLKRIPAPSLHLTPTGDECLDDTLETIQESPFTHVSEIRELQVPDIVITGSSSDTEEATTPCIILRSSDLSGTTTVTTPSDLNETLPEFSPCSEDYDNNDRPTSLNLARRKIAVTDDILRSPVDDDAISVSSAFSQNDEGEIDDEDLALPEEHEEEVKPVDPYTTMPPPQLIPELTAMEETAEERHWRSVVIGGIWRRIDMKVIAPYRKCLSHGGYIGDDQNAIIVFSSCFLPDRSRRDYNYVMDNLFLYVLSMLEQLVTEDYILVYLSGGTPRSHMPNFQWLKRAYQMIDRKLRKNLKALHVVHPTFWVRTVVALTRPFISTKFYKKLTFVNNLTELAQILPLDKLEIPDAVKHYLFFAVTTASEELSCLCLVLAQFRQSGL
ncbi:uncharacterized protein LOC143040968 isoform X2 [Oratosquilla oratoria]|uniref:uncharacterized protein LOC143040968 isoform X2 n=1 Tax=Oratosquilla oratoria TaxID=337810 RepID=UPI003F767E0E